MYRLSLLGLPGVLIAAAPASAAPFGEVPFTRLDDTADCLQATGAPGELVRSPRTGVRFMTASPAGLADAGELAVENVRARCPAVAAQPNAAGVLAVANTLVALADGRPALAWADHRGAFARFEVSRASKGILRIGRFLGELPLAPVHRGPVRIRLLYGGPGARHPAARVVTLRLRSATASARASASPSWGPTTCASSPSCTA